MEIALKSVLMLLGNDGKVKNDRVVEICYPVKVFTEGSFFGRNFENFDIF